MKNPGKILVIQTSFIGDVILATGVLEALHAAHPSSTIDVLVRKGNETLFEHHPFIRKILHWDKKNQKHGGLLKQIKTTRRAEYDLVVNLHRFGSSGLITALSGAHHRAGFDKNPFSRFYTHRVPHKFDGKHEIERNQSVINPFCDFDQPHKPKLYPGSDDVEFVAKFNQTPYRCIAPASVWFTKQWPIEKWVELINRFPKDETIYLLGGPDDAALCSDLILQVQHERCVSLAGQLTLLQSAALMKNAQMNYVNDSAPMHLASSVNAPVKAVYCSTVPAFGFGPLSDHSEIIETQVQLDCRPCGLHGYNRCPKGHFKCALSIEIDQVYGD